MIRNLDGTLSTLTMNEGGSLNQGAVIVWDSYLLPACPQALLDEYSTQIHASDTTANAKLAAMAALSQRLFALGAQSDLTAADVKEAIFKFLKLKILEGHS